MVKYKKIYKNNYEENNSYFRFEQHLALKSKYIEKQIEIYKNKNKKTKGSKNINKKK